MSAQLPIIQHWFRRWLGVEQATSHFLNQCWASSMILICVTRPQCVYPSFSELFSVNIYKCIYVLYHSSMLRRSTLLWIGKGPAYPVWSIPWLLMTWQRKEPVHQQPWSWQRRHMRCTINGFNTLTFQADGILPLPVSVRLSVRLSDCLSVCLVVRKLYLVRTITNLSWNHQICTKHASSWDTLICYWKWGSLDLQDLFWSFWLRNLGNSACPRDNL